MKTKFMIAMVMFALSSALTVPAVWADESGAKEKKYSKTTLKRYDKDKDGKPIARNASGVLNKLIGGWQVL